MINIKKPNVSDAPWKILFSALFLSFIGLVALNSISYQSTSIALNPFYKQLIFLFLALKVERYFLLLDTSLHISWFSLTLQFLSNPIL